MKNRIETRLGISSPVFPFDVHYRYNISGNTGMGEDDIPSLVSSSQRISTSIFCHYSIYYQGFRLTMR